MITKTTGTPEDEEGGVISKVVIFKISMEEIPKPVENFYKDLFEPNKIILEA